MSGVSFLFNKLEEKQFEKKKDKSMRRVQLVLDPMLLDVKLAEVEIRRAAAAHYDQVVVYNVEPAHLERCVEHFNRSGFKAAANGFTSFIVAWSVINVATSITAKTK